LQLEINFNGIVMFKKVLFPLITLLFIVLLFYFKYFNHHLLPIPADILPGMYLPWMDSYSLNIPVKNHLPSDIVSLTYPLRWLSIFIFKQGFWPLYNPQILSGTPLLANIQSAVLYPLNILYFFFSSFSDVWSWQIILQLILGFIFTYLFLKDYQLNTYASTFGAIAWSTGGFFSLWSQYNTVIHAIIYLPLALLSLKKINHHYLWGIVLSLSVTFSFLAGNPPLTLILIFTLSIYYFLLNRFQLIAYLKLIPFIVLTILLTSPLILPSLEISANSIRKFDQVALNNDIKTIPISKTITLTTPDFFGNPSTLNQWGSNSLYDNLTIFQGVTILFLAYLAISLKFNQDLNKLKIFSLITSLLSLLFITTNPISSFLSKTSFLGLNSMVFTRFHTLLNFSISILAALTIDQLISAKKSFTKLLFSNIIILIQTIIPILTLLIIFLINKKLIQTNYHPSFEPYDHSILERNFLVSLRNSILPIFVSLSILFSSLLAKYFSKFKILFVIILFCLMIFENYNFFRKYNSFSDPKFLYQPTSVTDYLKEHSFRFARETGEIIPSNTWMPYGLNSASGYDTLHSLKYNQFISLLNGGSLKNVTNRYLEIEKPSSKLINFLAIDHYLAIKRDKNYRLDPQGKPRPEILENKNLIPVFDNGRVQILKNPNSLPLFYSVNKYLYSSSIDTTEKYLKEIDLADTVILHQETNLKDLSETKISSLNYQPNQYTFQTTNTQNSLIVSSVPFDSSWKLKIDGQSSPIIQSNHAFISFIVPSGNHSISLNYHPNSFFLGIKLFLFGLSLIFLFLLRYFIPKINIKH